MSIEVTPYGYRCERACDYCYQAGPREATDNSAPPYSMDAMKDALEKEGHRFTIFGGEPLLMDIRDMEDLFAWGKQRFGEAAKKHGQRANGIQTDGYLCTDEHIRIFRRYDVGVGFSIDGPGELNDARAMREGGYSATQIATGKSIWALEKMLAAKMGPSLIVTLNRHNASPDRLPRLLDWFRDLESKGLRHVNLHLLEVENEVVREKLALTEDENVEALLACARLQAETDLTFEPIGDMVRLLRGEDQWDKREDGGYNSGTSCIWNKCPANTTPAVQGVDGQGNRRNCGRTYKDGVQMVKGDAPNYARYISLYHTPQAFGGCAGCRWFYACGGNCPGTAEGNDLRGRTEHCGTLKKVFSALEAMLIAEGVQPFSLSEDRPIIERMMLREWQAGRGAMITPLREALATGQVAPLGGEQGHLDVPHGDDHEDSDDPDWVEANPDWREQLNAREQKEAAKWASV